MKTQLKTNVLIIGGGVTGTSVLRDLTLRGIDCLLVEKKDMNAGASGANHGLLHSGARYAASDPEAALECMLESQILKETAPFCIEDTGGLFIAIEGDDENYIADFPHACSKLNIYVQKVSPERAKELEPGLSSSIIAAFQVKDASIDPFMLSQENIKNSINAGSRVLYNTQVTGFQFSNGKRSVTQTRNRFTGEQFNVEADIVVNAGGAWASKIAEMAGDHIPMTFSKGTLLITGRRISNRVINRLRMPGDADIVVPGGTVSIMGTTSSKIDDPDEFHPTIAESETIIDETSKLFPALQSEKYIRAYSGVRPLFGENGPQNDRNLSRGYSLIDHSQNGIQNFITITGGKLTTCRLMAEKTGDLVCRSLGISKKCRTKEIPLKKTPACKWTKPGTSSKNWFKNNAPKDLLLCECEMISKSVINKINESIIEEKIPPTLLSVALRSRLGKGPCQGAFCAFRVTAHMYNKKYFKGSMGIHNLKAFIQNRFKGIRSVLMGPSVIQSEMQEAFQCGLFNLEQ